MINAFMRGWTRAQQENWWAKWQRRRNAYKMVFEEHPEGRFILEDLCKKFHVLSLKKLSDHEQGQRAVVLWILRYVKQNDSKAVAEVMAQMQRSQNRHENL